MVLHYRPDGLQWKISHRRIDERNGVWVAHGNKGKAKDVAAYI